MNQKLRQDAQWIAEQAIRSVKPDAAVRRALEQVTLTGKVYLVAVGKAAWQMAHAAVRELKEPIYKGIVITKYDHVMEQIPGVTCYEAGHPVPDGNSYAATQAVLDMTRSLEAEDTVLFLLSRGAGCGVEGLGRCGRCCRHQRGTAS